MFRIIKWIYRTGYRQALMSIESYVSKGGYIGDEYIQERIDRLDEHIREHGADINFDR